MKGKTMCEEQYEMTASQKAWFGLTAFGLACIFALVATAVFIRKEHRQNCLEAGGSWGAYAECTLVKEEDQ